jgi:amino acid adenylation domain-containing protein/thioester reductase-like protein/non-ribosomal peptide synthase protein (TIGR01720 family)
MSLNAVFSLLKSRNIALLEEEGELVIRGPQGAMDEDLLAQLKLNKQGLLTALRNGHDVSITPQMLTLVELSQEEIDGIVANVDGGTANIQDIYPLAPLQEGILFHHLLESQGDPYVKRTQIVFENRRYLDNFIAALKTVIERHDILRSALHWQGLPQPVQVVQRRVELPVHDLSGFDAEARLSAATDPRQWKMNLQQAPLVHVYIAAEQDSLAWRLVLLNHHLIDDNYTLQLVLTEIRLLLAGHGSELPAPLPYRNFIARMRRTSQAEHEAYFREQLGDVDETTAPFGLLNVQGDGGKVEQTMLMLNSDAAQRVRDAARRFSVTPASLFHVAWALVMGRCCGRDDVVFGTVLSGRLQGGTGAERAVGMFINTLPIRIRLAEISVAEITALVHGCLNELLAHEQASLTTAQRCSGLPAGMPLFTSLLNYRHSTFVEADDKVLLAWEGAQVIFSEERTNYPLTLSVDDLGKDFGLTVQAAQGIVPMRIAEYFYSAMAGLSDALLHNPARAVTDIDMLPAAERRQMLEEWNPTAGEHSYVSCLQSLFEIQVAKTPDAWAVTYAGQTLTYAELNARANRLAHYLIGQDVGPDVLVGICIERSLEMVIGLLGILKAGGAYVPIDPAYPGERIRYILDDADTKLLLTCSELVVRFHSMPAGEAGREETLSIDVQILCLDKDWSTIALCPDSNPAPRSHPLDLAYLIYTSGSTGQPKGVAVTHRNAVHSTQARSVEYPDPVRAYLLLSSFAFDSSVAGIFWTLGQGGWLCLPGGEAGKDLALLAELIERYRISHLLALPSLYALLLEQSAEKLNSLTVAIVAGEACAIQVVKQHFAVLPSVKLYNEYGPTEGTVWSSVYQAGLDDLDRPLSIGRPIANVHLYILDRYLNPLPVGVAGELYIGGAGIVRGYWQRSELTAERFIPAPFESDGGRLYKTGDLARYRADGAIEFLGRIDHQVKIRGFRIEIGEIEARLLVQPEVKDAVVMAREDQPGDKKLVAYLVLSEAFVDQDEAVLDGLKTQLKHTLPDYMVPSIFVVLDEMPLSANGKLDRKRLLAPDWSGQGALSYEPPQNSVEVSLTQIWQQLLGIERIGRHDNFFALGGDSILSIQAVSRARQAGIVITPKQLFEQSTIAELAAIAVTISRAEAEQGQVTGEVALTPIQHWFFERGLVNPHHWNQALLLTVRPELTPEVLAAALQTLLTQHDALRMRFIDDDGQWRQINRADEVHSGFEYIDLSTVPAAQRTERLKAEICTCQASLDLNQGSLMRGVWFDLGDGEHRVLLVIHHLVVDGVSWRILLEDLETACRQGLAGQCPALPLKTSSFQYWAQRLTKLTREGSSALNAEYWLDPRRRQIQALPVDRVDGANLAGLEEEVAIELSGEQTRTLLQDVPAAYRTRIDDLLLTALALTLHDWCNDQSPREATCQRVLTSHPSETYLLIDRESHGREHLADDLDVSRTVGWFTSVYPLLLTVNAEADLAQSLKSIKEQLRAVPDNGLSYGRLRYLSADAETKQDLAELPPARIIFNYLGQLDTVLNGDYLFSSCAEAIGLSHDPIGERAHELAIVACIREGRLQLSWRYSRERHHRATLEVLADRYLQRLQALIDHCRQSEHGGYTPSDFPLSALSQNQLDALSLPPRKIDDIYPLVPLQHGLMFHSLYESDTKAYRIQLACRLSGPLDATAFQQAWQQLLKRHAILRTRFLVQGAEQPLQIVEHQVRLPIDEHDWRHLPEAERQARWRALKIADHAQGFDFNQAPLMRLNLAKSKQDEHYLLWSYHHVLLDGWSMPLLIRDVFTIYQALRRSEQPEPTTVRYYSDYIAWLQNQDKAAAEQYWRQQLAGFEVATVLGVDQTPGDKGSVSAIRKRSLTLTVTETQGLQRFVKQRQLTLNTLAQAAWGLLLGHYSGSDDIVFGITVSGRPAELAGVENQVGLFINTLPMRIRIEPQISIGDWLLTLFEQNQVLRSYEYAPLVQIQSWSEVSRGQSLFNSLLVFENYPIDRALMEIGGPLKIDEVVGLDPTNYPLTLTVFPGERLQLEINHDSRRFCADTVTEMLEHLQQLLVRFAEQPQTKLGNLPTLTADQQKKILLDWNATAAIYPQNLCLHQLFEAQVEKTPAAIALTFEAQSLTYAELNVRANQLAHYLIEQGVGPDVLVGICIERSLEMVIGLLGILKAGGAYVPLDPHYPEGRRRCMLDDAGISLLLTRQNLVGLVASEQRPTVYLDQDWTTINLCSDTNPAVRNHPLDLAYIIYTSGSTGQPKGVAVTHRNAVHSTFARFTQYPDQVNAYLLLSSFAFDSSVAGIFWTLGQGGCLCLPGEDAGKDPAALATLIQHLQVSHLLALPSLYAVLLEQDPESLRSLKTAIVAGEACAIQVVKQHFAVLPSVKLYNEYGPTEGTVWSSVYQAGLDDLDRPLSIGRPIANVHLYILDRYLNPLPVGVAGELYIGGAGIVRGYQQRSELTSERFIPDPFQADGGRLYKTGDLARYRPDETIEFLGRIDHQVKIRGFRIELGEIEAQLLAYADVKEAVVLAREDQPGDKKLVAYLVLSESAVDQNDVVADNLKAQLKQVLPDYMMPSIFVVLDEMPLSANSKLDWKRLPAPDWSGQAALSYEAPQNPLEVVLTQIWQQLLAIERIGRHDNFFALGGDSILSIQVVSRARQAGIVINPKQLFERPTVFELASVAETVSRAVAEQGLVEGSIALTPIQHWFFERGLHNPHHWNQALLLTIRPELTPEVFAAALQTLLTQHDALRMRFIADDGQWRQTNLVEETQCVFECIDLSTVTGEQRLERLQAEATTRQAALNLRQGPLLRTVWFDLGNGERRVLIAIHHLVVDGVSWRILLEDLSLACQQGMSNQCLNLPAKTTSFQYWAKRLNQLTQNGELNLSTDYWLAPQRAQAATLPVDDPNGANHAGLEEEIVVTLSGESTLALLQEVPAAYRTQIDDVLLTALALALRDWQADAALSASAQTATTTLLIDREGHGREYLADDLDISRTVGWFTSVYPLLLALPDGDDLAQALKTVKEQIREVPDHGISYGMLRYLSADAKIRQALADQQQAQIIFNYLGQLDTVLSQDALFAPSTEAVGLSHDPTGKRAHELDVVVSILNGCLQLSWRYSRERYRRSTLETLANRYLQHLQALISHCSQTGVGSYTPSDFPLAVLSQPQLDGLKLAPRHIDDIYPLAPLQHGLIFHSLYEPGANVYRIQITCRLTGPLDVTVFQQAWQQLLERHAILRTRFPAQGLEQALQIVDKQARLPIIEHDWHNLPEDQRQDCWQQLQAVDHAQGFDFDRAPLMRLHLARVAEDVHYLLWSYHHVLLDGWSMPLLIKEVFTTYHALQLGERPNLPTVKPYRDYIAWLQRQDMAAAERYWRQALAGFEATTILGVEQTASDQNKTGETQKHSLLLTEEESHGLQQFVKRRQLTLNTLAQAAWSLLLSHYSGNKDIVFGITVSGRPAELIGVEHQVGLYINTLPMRVKLNPQAQVDDWLQTLFEQNQELRRYEYASLAQIQTWSDISRGQALFDSLLVFENYPIDRALMDIGGPLKIDEVIGIDPTNYPLTLTVFPGERLQLEINHDSRRFCADTVTEMLEHLQQLLVRFAEQPQTKLGNLPTLTEDQQKKIFLDWNATAAIYPQNLCLHQLFEAQVEKTPAAIALTFEAQSLTYAELNVRANQLAHYLIEQGVGPDVLVGICIERSLEMVIGLLGILKAGGAYVPLDPHYPEERLVFMLNDIAALVILTQARFNTLDFGNSLVLCLDSGWARVESYPTANTQPDLKPGNLAYCIYTSGSTGQPKGSGVPHEGILNRLQWMQAEYRLDCNDGVLQKTPYSFDVSVWEFFWPLMTGARLVVATPELHKDSQGLIELIRREQITTIHFVPSMLQAFVEAPEVEQCRSLKRVVCSGEALPADLVQRFQKKLSAELHNLYGPTEASVDVSYWACPADSRETAIPIGKPIANIRLYILDQSLNLVSAGTPGELHIAGIGLGRGYLNRPGLTAEKFIPDPYGLTGSRLYKTGDLVRYRTDGNIDYLGRIDYQVKIRGFRIELGEIEAQLLLHPKVKEAVVLTREDQPGDKRLVAYLVEDQLGTLQLDELKVLLKQSLPDYMVPGAFVVLEQMPLSANGKLDRKRLPAPDIGKQHSKQNIVPRNKTETVLAEIWHEILGGEPVGMEDDFFELGGHSLLAAQLFFQVQKRLAITATFKDFLGAPTIAAQAQLLDVGQSIESVLDLEAEAILDPAIVPIASDAIDVAAAENVLLTGATGFLGAFILADLLELTQATIYCLVRAENEQLALLRLQSQIEQYELLDRIDFSRIVAVCGDLSEMRLGLSESRYQDISERVEVIYHNGALVNFVQPYQALKAANVLGTQEVLRLACFGKAKAIHYVSTVSVFSEPPLQSTGHKETDEPIQYGNLPNGYAQSKWVAEKLVVAAKERGFQVSIYRPAIVAGDSHTGAWNTSDFWCRLIKGCIQMGYAPHESVRVDMAPVDFMSLSIVALSLQPDSIDGVFHLSHPQPPYSDQWLDYFIGLGYRIQRIPYREWLEKALEIGRSNSDSYALASLLPSFADQLRNEHTSVLADGAPLYDCQATFDVLSTLGIGCEPMNRSNAMTLYQSYFVRRGFLFEPMAVS